MLVVNRVPRLSAVVKQSLNYRRIESKSSNLDSIEQKLQPCFNISWHNLLEELVCNLKTKLYKAFQV